MHSCWSYGFQGNNLDWLRLQPLLASGVQQMVTLTVVGYLCQDVLTVDGLELVCTTPGSL